MNSIADELASGPIYDNFVRFSKFIKDQLIALKSSGKTKVSLSDAAFFNESVQQSWMKSVIPYIKSHHDKDIEGSVYIDTFFLVVAPFDTF